MLPLRKIFKCVSFGEMDNWLTTNEAGEILHVSAARIRQMIRDGVIRGSQKLGRDHLIPSVEVDRLKGLDRKPGRPPKRRD